MDTDGPGSSTDESAKPTDGSEPQAKSLKCSEYGRCLARPVVPLSTDDTVAPPHHSPL